MTRSPKSFGSPYCLPLYCHGLRRLCTYSSLLTPHLLMSGPRSSSRPAGAAKFIRFVLTYMASGSLPAVICVLILSSNASGICSCVTLIFGYFAMKSSMYFLTRLFSVGLPPQFAARRSPVTSCSLLVEVPPPPPPPLGLQAESSRAAARPNASTSRDTTIVVTPLPHPRLRIAQGRADFSAPP